MNWTNSLKQLRQLEKHALFRIIPPYILIVLFCVFSISSLQSQNIYINEFMASNKKTITDEFGEFEDWVEIYNVGPNPFDLGGLYITDDLTEPDKWQIPNTNPNITTILPGRFLILWFDGDTDQGLLHVKPKLGTKGEQIGIFDANLNPLDTLTYGEQKSDVSEGRTPDASSNFTKLAIPTPGMPNAIPELEKISPPTMSKEGGFYKEAFSLTLSTEIADAQIYYTIGGSEPSELSNLYTTPILIDASQTIRAIVAKNGFESSAIITQTFLFNEASTFPIIALSGDPDQFFGEATGLFPNFEQDIETPINAEFYEPNGTQGFNQVVEVQIHGSTSAVFDQKSLALKAKGSLGKSKFEYPVFPDQPFDEYRSLVLRNSGQDWEYTMFRDALESSFVRDLSDLEVDIAQFETDGQAYRPVVTYINGKYWGIYNLRERLDWRYIKTHYDLDKDEIDLLENDSDAKEGDFDDWNQLDSLLMSKSFTTTADLEQLATMVDLDNYRDYVIFNLFVDNTDWPGNNYIRWKERKEEGRWRWMIKDLDWAYGFAELNSGTFNTGNPDVNSLKRMLNPTFFFPNPHWATLLFEKLMENPEWKTDFINRMADQINVLYPAERMLQRIDDFQNLYQPEIKKHNQKWQNVWTWEQDIDKLRIFAAGRPAAVHKHFVETIPELTGTSELTVTAFPENGGKIKVNSITTDQNNYPWKGTYFNGVEVPISAIPNPGFTFVTWSANVPNSTSANSIQLDGDISITAVFRPILGDSMAQTIDFLPIADKTIVDSIFVISATASSGLPVSFTILEGPATLKGDTVLLTGTTGKVIIRAMQEGNEDYLAAPTVEQVFLVKEAVIKVPTEDYCKVSGEAPWQEYIANVTLNTLDNTSFKEGYGDFTNLSTTLQGGKEYEINLLPGFSFFQWDEVFQVWIDFDKNNQFTEEEVIYSGTYKKQTGGSEPAPVTGVFTVPFSVEMQETRMRVMMQRDSVPSACTDFTFGEVEDYSIQLISPITSLNQTKRDKHYFTAYPNPAKEVLYIHSEKLLDKPATLSILDIYGRTLKTIESGALTPFPIAIPLQNWASGLYYLQIKMEGEPFISRKIMIDN